MKSPGWWRAAMFASAALLPGVLLPARPAAAAGYGIYEQGAAALGRAGAATASAGDASAMFFNPAAMVWMKQREAQLGLTLLQPTTSFAGVAPYPGFGVVEEMEAQTFPLPNAYFVLPRERWAVGVGVFAPYGLGVEWDNAGVFSGRYIVTKANLETVNLAGTLAWRLHPRVSVAAGPNALFSKVKLTRRNLAPIPGGGGAQVDVAEVVLESDIGTGYTWNAALSVLPCERWRMGATYRGKVVAKPDGSADFTQIPTGDAAFDAAVAASLPPDQGASTVLRFPAIWAAGVAWMPGNWTLEADAVFTEWSVFSDLPLSFDDPALDTSIEEDYDDTWAVRLGAEQRLERFTYRFGVYREEAAAPAESVSPLLPDAERTGVTLGLGWALGGARRWTIDVYNLSLFVDRRDTEGVNRDGFDGEYKSYVNAFGFNVGYRW